MRYLFNGQPLKSNTSDSSFAFFRDGLSNYILHYEKQKIELAIVKNHHNEKFERCIKFHEKQKLLKIGQNTPYKYNRTYDFALKFQDILNNDNDFFSFLNERFIFSSYRFTVDLSQEIRDATIKADNEILEKLKYNGNSQEKDEEKLKFILKVIYFYLLENNSHDKDKFDFEKSNNMKNMLDGLIDDMDSDIFSHENVNWFLSLTVEHLPMDATVRFIDDYEVVKSEVRSIEENLIKDELKNELMKYLYEKNILVCDFFHGENPKHDFSNLSDGEKMYIKLLTYVAYELQQASSSDLDILLLLDEIEISLHPAWQQKLISNILTVVRQLKITQKIYITANTHSPFLLSDIPKENVIFLDTVDDKTTDKYPLIDVNNPDKGNCINVTKYMKIKTFGENIHTLLTHAFFMEDGLMGKFARSKIEEVLKFCYEVKEERNDLYSYRCIYEDKHKYFWHVQRSIGEKYICKIVENELKDVEQILFDTDESIDREIKRLESLKKSRK